ncbi:MAG: transposase [Pirellulales bacterium]
MARPKRDSVFPPNQVNIAHCIQRCVRRAFLAGKDTASGKNYEHRRTWIRQRMEMLASVFGIDVLSYAIMSNHVHSMLRTRPDIVELWSDEDVATRWLRLFPGKRLEDFLGEPSPQQIAMEIANAKRMKELRTRLSSISWFMRALSETIARKANKEDQCTGRFWEGRFKAQKIVDEAGLLACATYVDLNPVRAAMAELPERSIFTSVFDRLYGERRSKRIAADIESQSVTVDEELIQMHLDAAVLRNDKEEIVMLRKCLANYRKKEQCGKSETSVFKSRTTLTLEPLDAWLAPLQISERGEIDPTPHHGGKRASDKGFLSMTVADYATLLDWTGREGRIDKTGRIPIHLEPILERLGIEGSMWCELVWNYSKYFGKSQAAGKPENLKAEALNRDVAWIRGQRICEKFFVRKPPKD